MTKSRALVTLPKAFLPTGGLRILYDDEPLSDNDSWPRKVIALWGGNRASLMSNLPFVSVSIPRHQLMFLLEEALKQKLLYKGDLIKVYGLQSKEVRAHRSWLDLRDIKGLKRDGKHLFQIEELVAIASSVQTVSERDVAMFLSDKESHELLPTDLIRKWAQDHEITALARAQILELMYRRDPKSLDQDTLESVLRCAAREAPLSGAVQIAVKVMYDVERVRKNAKRDRSREEFANTIVSMVTPLPRRPSVSFHEARKLLGWYLTNPFFKQEDKDWVETEVRFHVDTIARLYVNFISDAKTTDSAFDTR